MMIDIDEALDWQGNAVDCASCPHRELLASGGCELKKACVQDRYARRLDRFFQQNRPLADAYLDHPYFETRAVAAGYATVFLLPRLLQDPDETVRWSAARRLPRRYLLPLRADLHREVRIRIASVLSDEDLRPMVNDADYYVRQIVARRASPGLLPLLVLDPDSGVRREVARRIGPEWLAQMAMDKDADVRIEAVRRMSPGRLLAMIGDPDWRIRYDVASRVDPYDLGDLLDDPDPLVRELVRSRTGFTGGARSGPNQPHAKPVTEISP